MFPCIDQQVSSGQFSSVQFTYLETEFVNLGQVDAPLEFHDPFNVCSGYDCPQFCVQIMVLSFRKIVTFVVV
jgi:hypothetical protein